MGISNALNNRPVRVLGFITALHSFTYGVGYLFAAGGFSETVLYTGFKDPTITIGFGVALVITGCLLAFAYTRNNPKTIKFATLVQSAVWLFASVSYLLTGAWLLALGISLPWALVSSYLSYAHGNRLSIIAYDQTRQAKIDTANEDQL